MPMSYEEAKAMTVLRSGKEIEKPIHPKNPPPLDNSIPTNSFKVTKEVEPPTQGESSTSTKLMSQVALLSKFRLLTHNG